MGLNVFPPIWQSYINMILNCLESRKYCETIMDDLLLFTPSKQMHMRKLEDLLKALLKNGLKISPMKCQLFKIELQYICNTILIQEKRVCVKPLHSRLEEDGKGRFHLYSDTSKYATGSALYQIQNGKPKLIGHASKRLPEAATHYSITELEMCGLAINITGFTHLLKKVEFDAIVDHLALVHILKSKTELRDY